MRRFDVDDCNRLAIVHCGRSESVAVFELRQTRERAHVDDHEAASAPPAEALDPMCVNTLVSSEVTCVAVSLCVSACMMRFSV